MHATVSRLALLGLLLQCGSAATPTAYNVLFLSSDSLDGRLLDPNTRYHSLVELPSLRGLAASGANFVSAYSHSPVCGPSRASMITSRFVHEIGVWNNYQELVPAPGPTGVDDKCVKLYGLEQCRAWAALYPVNFTLFDAFTEAGYDMSGIFGKLDFGANSPMRWPTSDNDDDHTGPELRNVPRAADILLDSMGRVESNTTGGPNPHPSDAAIIAKAVAWLEARPAAQAAEAQPFFLYAGLSLPHFPFITNSTWLACVNRSAITLPPWKPIAQMHPYDRHMTTSKGCAYDFSDDAVLQLRAVYLAMAAEADALHGRLLSALAASPYANNTIVVFFSDHGEMALEARQVYKDTLRDPSSRVPIIIAGPGITAGQTLDLPVSLLDLWPTLSDLVGIPQAPQARGHSLAPLLAGASGDAVRARPSGAVPPPGAVVAEFHGENSNTGNFMLRCCGGLKYLAYGHTFPWFSTSAYPPQLFNLSHDPLELSDLAPSNPALVATLNAQLMTMLGVHYEDIDATAKANDQLIFSRYVAANKSDAQLEAEFEDAYTGWNSSWAARVRTWIVATPSPMPSASARAADASAARKSVSES